MTPVHGLIQLLRALRFTAMTSQKVGDVYRDSIATICLTQKLRPRLGAQTTDLGEASSERPSQPVLVLKNA